MKRSQLHSGDILVNLVGASIGRACIFEEDCAANINQAVAVISLSPSNEKLTKFVLAFLLSDRGQAYLLGSRVEGARANISLKDLRELPIPKASDEQLALFDRRLKEVDQAYARGVVSLSSVNALFASLQHRAFRGEL